MSLAVPAAASRTAERPVPHRAQVLAASAAGRRAAGRGVVEFYNSSNLTFASSIAYYALLSFFPFILLLLTISWRIAISDRQRHARWRSSCARAEPFDFVVNQIQELSKAPPGSACVGTSCCSGRRWGVFGAITSAVNHAWGVEKPRGFFKHKLIAFIML